MHEESGGKGLVYPEMPTLSYAPAALRYWLLKAGVTRAQLHKTTTVSKQTRWHDLRATGLTWYAVEGEPATEIRDIAGHTQTSMTDRYMRSAANLRGGGSARSSLRCQEAGTELSRCQLPARQLSVITTSQRKRTGIEPAQDALAPRTGFEYRGLHQHATHFQKGQLQGNRSSVSTGPVF